MNKRIGYLAFALLGISLTGCSTVDHQTVSKPRAVTSLVTEAGKIEVENVEVYVRSTNHVTRGTTTRLLLAKETEAYDRDSMYLSSPYYYSTAPMAFPRLGEKLPSFYIEVLVEPSRNARIDPTEAVLSLTNGRQVRAKSYLGPLKVYSQRNYNLPLCDIVAQGLLGKTRSGTQELRSEPLELQAGVPVCIAVEFPISPPLPEENFQLTLGAIKFSNGNKPFPHISFGQEKIDYHRH